MSKFLSAAGKLFAGTESRASFNESFAPSNATTINLSFLTASTSRRPILRPARNKNLNRSLKALSIFEMRLPNIDSQCGPGVEVPKINIAEQRYLRDLTFCSADSEKMEKILSESWLFETEKFSAVSERINSKSALIFLALKH